MERIAGKSLPDNGLYESRRQKPYVAKREVPADLRPLVEKAVEANPAILAGEPRREGASGTYYDTAQLEATLEQGSRFLRNAGETRGLARLYSPPQAEFRTTADELKHATAEIAPTMREFAEMARSLYDVVETQEASR